MQLPEVHDWPGPQLPHDPPHPSSPHTLPAQSGVQLHFPLERHVEPVAQAPHEPPQPSGPHSLPAQAGEQTHFPFALHAAAPEHVPHEPPHPSVPHSRPAHAGVHAESFPASVAVSSVRVSEGVLVSPPDFVSEGEVVSLTVVSPAVVSAGELSIVAESDASP